MTASKTIIASPAVAHIFLPCWWFDGAAFKFRLGDGAGAVSDSAVESGGAGGLLRIIVGAGAGA